MNPTGTLTRIHCDAHVDAQGDQIPCPGHYVRLDYTVPLWSPWAYRRGNPARKVDG